MKCILTANITIKTFLKISTVFPSRCCQAIVESCEYIKIFDTDSLDLCSHYQIRATLGTVKMSGTILAILSELVNE